MQCCQVHAEVLFRSRHSNKRLYSTLELAHLHRNGTVLKINVCDYGINISCDKSVRLSLVAALREICTSCQSSVRYIMCRDA